VMGSIYWSNIAPTLQVCSKSPSALVQGKGAFGTDSKSKQCN
jgi:hypothetical protein